MNSKKGKRACSLPAFWAVQAGMLCLLAGLYLAVRYGGLRVPCLFSRLTGLCCPGCGNTRAVFACMRFDFLGALKSNLLFPLEFAYIGWVWISASVNWYRKGKFRYSSPSYWIDLSVLAAILIWGIVRNIIGM